jgi:hypothetical protein
LNTPYLEYYSMKSDKTHQNLTLAEEDLLLEPAHKGCLTAKGRNREGQLAAVVPLICQPQHARDREAKPGFDRRQCVPSRASSLNALSRQARSGRELTRSWNIAKCPQHIQSIAGSTFSAQRYRASVAKNGQQPFGTQRCTLTHTTYRQAGSDVVALHNEW